MKRNILMTALGAALLAGGLGVAVASNSAQQTNGEDDLNIAQTKVTLIQAVTAAEQKVGGRAARAELNDENGKLVYSVEVVNDTQATDVKVDAMSGQILTAKADLADEEHEGKGESNDD